MIAISTKISVLLDGMVSEMPTSADIAVTSITLDSRTVVENGVFLSLSKDAEQHKDFLKQALNNGAIAIVYDDGFSLSEQEKYLCKEHGATLYAVENLAIQAGEIAARFYGHPSENLTVLAITGTNGKTSVSQFIAQAFESLAIPCGVIGTLGVGRVERMETTGMTTPDPVTLQSVLAEFKSQSINHVVLEASSHALEQGRLNSVAIDVAVFTNLSRDHLDYHQTMQEYAAAKLRLFKFASIKHAVVNLDDDFAQSIITAVNDSAVELLTYSSESVAEQKSELLVQAVGISTKPTGISFKLHSQYDEAEVSTSLLGHFNVANLLATLQGLVASGIEFETALKAITHCHAVNGRMEVYGGDEQVQVVIDFAHTPDALIQAMTSLRAHLTDTGQLWCVFGCGGDRDKGKRALMGEAVEIYADKLVITSDNPRSESNETIVEEILTGINDTTAVVVEHDRKKAIKHAIKAATTNDIVLVAGKGHEQYQEIAGIKHPFSDKEIVMLALAAANDDQHNVGAAL